MYSRTFSFICVHIILYNIFTSTDGAVRRIFLSSHLFWTSDCTQYGIIYGRTIRGQAIFNGHRIWIRNIIGFGAFRESYNCGAQILEVYLMGHGGLQRFERRVCNDLNSRLFLVFKIPKYITRASPTDSSTAT